ncbi:MAG: aminotransferase class IV [Clostridia bacterium]|nr:aminotransferase class IV [Clostridia bacterium]
MDDNVGKYYIDDGAIKESSESKGIGRNDGIMIYDVVRVIDGIPLFYEDHYIRTCQSFHAIGNVCNIEPSDMKDQIHKIVELNENYNCNIKFIMFTVDGMQKTIGYVCRSHYPSPEEINKGVSVGLYSLERENPNIKIVDYDYKKKINRIKEEKDFYEVFLVDREGNITEGGTSNIFFIKGEKIYTAPDEKVLKGITRMHVIESCKTAGRLVIEAPVPVESICDADAVFISGTSPKVMPVSAIDDKKYDSARHPVVEAIRKAFDEKIKNYLDENKEASSV